MSRRKSHECNCRGKERYGCTKYLGLFHALGKRVLLRNVYLVAIGILIKRMCLLNPTFLSHQREMKTFNLIRYCYLTENKSKFGSDACQ